jgi:hypothetical protein
VPVVFVVGIVPAVGAAAGAPVSAAAGRGGVGARAGVAPWKNGTCADDLTMRRRLGVAVRR